MDFSKRVLEWFEANGRHDLPWQFDPTPYRVWVSEIMLQQTQVTTVVPYYRRFMDSFPDVIALADAPTDSVMHHWSGLGYYARARNLHQAAAIVRDKYDGNLPESFEELTELPGIGRSTAGAMLALSLGQRHAILDGNVKRVLARHDAIEGWPGRTAVADQLWQLSEARTPVEQVDSYTQAIMDLGATICTRSNPGCLICPVADDCQARLIGRIDEFPGRKVARKKPHRITNMVLALDDTDLYLERRPAAGIWGGLWSLPELEDQDEVADWCRRKLDCEADALEHWPAVHHSFTHFDLDIQPIVVRLGNASSKVADNDDRLWYSLISPPEIGLAAPVKVLINNLGERVREI